MGKRVLWIAVPLGITMVAGGAFAWLRHEALALPAWYEKRPQALDLPSSPESVEPGAPQSWVAVPDAVEAPKRSVNQGKTRSRPRGRRELRNFHVQAVAKEPAFRRAIKGSRAVYRDGKLEIGAVIEIDAIPTDKLTPQAKKTFRRIERVFPGLKGKAVYVGLEDEPVTRDGVLQLGKNPQVKVGNLGMSLNQLARRVGVSPRKVRRDLDRLFRHLRVTAPTASSDPPQ